VDYCTFSDIYPRISAVGKLRDAVDAVEADPVADPPVEAVAAVVATQLSETDGSELITQVSAEIDGHLLARGYVLPVFGDALDFLGAVCAAGTAGRILRSLFPAAAGVSGDAGSAAAQEREYADGLKLIDEGGLAADMSRSGTSIAYDFDDYSDVATETRKPTSEAPF